MDVYLGYLYLILLINDFLIYICSFQIFGIENCFFQKMNGGLGS